MRGASGARDATLISVLAYAGLRPGEALRLHWKHVGDRTLTVYAGKTGQRRSVRLLVPLAEDLGEWRSECGRAVEGDLVFPAADGSAWSEEAYKSWASRASRGRIRE